ncbi:MAG: SWIM zinc finger family protein [Ilumatobacteraceae bacterium]|nr:SWIM zinc finger family protein [Ilumatobacteraceae bacterium]
MSRPRKPYGPNPPGRLLGTMIKVLAAEMSDQGRLARGKRYWADDAVIDIVVGHGAVTAEIQGSRPEPYVVTIEASSGSGVPGKRDVWAQCTCPDDTGTGADLCKHAVAAFFTLADEVSIDPELVDRWRRSARRDRPDAEVTELRPARHDDEDHDDEDLDDHDDDHDDEGAEVIELRPRIDPDLDAISHLLRSPAGASPPEFPEVTELEHGLIRDPLLADVLADALDHLAIRWE